jgi:hypothetical protein
MRDYPDKNILLDDVEFSQAEVDQALRYVTSLYNVVTPISSLTVDGWPAGTEWIQLLGVSWYLVRSASFGQARNQLTYQAGDIAPVGIDDKFTLYQNLAQTLKMEWDTLVQEYKIQLNLESCYGSVSSGYRYSVRYNRS